MKVLIFVILVWAQHVSAYTYTRPVPTLPVMSGQVYDKADSISYSVIYQIHRALFKVGTTATPIQDLISTFEVANSGKLYRFTLMEGLKFHKGEPFTASEAAKSLKKGLRFKKNHLANKFGLGRILNSKVKPSRKGRWAAIYSTGKNDLVIQLSHANPRLIFYLADPRLSITKDNFRNGLGPFKILNTSKKTVTLERVDKVEKGLATSIQYVVASEEAAIQMLKDGNASDLTMYSISKSELDKIGQNVSIKKSLFPKTFTFVINPRAVKEKVRKQLTRELLGIDFVSKCQLPGSKTKSLIPKGFAGHFEVKLPKKSKQLKGKKVTIYIPEGVGSEECVVREIKNRKEKVLNIVTKRVQFGEILSGWNKDKIQVYYGYIEGETDFSLYEHFLPTSTFLLGNKRDTKFVSLYNKYIKNFSSIEKTHSIAGKLSMHLTNQFFVVPVYTPNYVIFDKRIKLSQPVLQAPYQIRLDDARMIQ